MTVSELVFHRNFQALVKAYHPYAEYEYYVECDDFEGFIVQGATSALEPIQLKGLKDYSRRENPEIIDNPLSWENKKPSFSCQIVVKNNGLIISTRPPVK